VLQLRTNLNEEKSMEQEHHVPTMNMDFSDRLELVPGHVYRKSIVGTAMSMSMIWMRDPADRKNNVIPPHKHGEEACFVLSGNGWVVIAGEKYRLEPGVSVVIPAGVDHYGTIDEGEEMVLLCVENPPRAGMRYYFSDVTKEGAPLIAPPSA
jgi:mannose-6-phosphate isomerase-like protein (cupin superfamily)